jgi:hypothetical protein
MARTARMVGGMKEAEAVELVYSVAYADYQKVWHINPTIVQCDMLISEYRHSKPNTIAGAVSLWLCDRAAWDASEREDNRRFAVCKKAYKSAAHRWKD